MYILTSIIIIGIISLIVTGTYMVAKYGNPYDKLLAEILERNR